MRRMVLSAVIAGLVFWTGDALAELKLGYIDSEILKERLPEFKEAQRKLDQLRQDFEREAQDREAKLLKLQEDFRKQELLMSEARKMEMQTEFEEKVRLLKEFTEMKFGPEGELMKKNVELSSPIFEKINLALQEMAKQDGYDFIFDAAAPGTGLVFAQEKFDLTEKLLELLKEKSEEAAKK
ncbi:MAG: OmpH family outer membrane protein [Gemmatimonadetes bacterium]|jgi:outer membrane protein|nr:OmpH family outer membrane protein [Gemmatimonadota bacterium]